ncbi:PTS sugar transporter subunit IIB [Salmonella enterica]|uniref:PTS sugar transporter subunit IIB n=2 Tax=Salmonella enterica TaxID=28901 RepID=A0A5Y2SCT8_SALHO|nr:PTS sugar transporter subunit IIB [Salmonella enterica]ECF6074341.1 PTS sugar transporter subunit IIB [Salmonella enterica subsp. houtenae]EDO5296344.1 PTS sugar transporter subunit IIB [Salmonella enterica subsp. houtenae serovar 40:z4,z24:-]EDS6439809.1 PTS sugar transporter subunit IIB [Salmonella enterica subsp. VII str. CFSAN000550]EDT6884266.1 PTS sugar transporter subunit IIB [Salmonella enterica subsp. enterica]QJY66287.1 PTS sugar transporter subunit IIB [Salmonella enterica subsp.
MKNSVNILFVCGYGVGSSVMLQTVVKKALAKYTFSFAMEHTAAGEVGGFTDWADIYAISKKLLDVVSLDPKHGQYLIPIENIMDGESIGKQIYDVVEKNFPHLLNK